MSSRTPTAPAAGAHVIRIDGDRIVAVEPAKAGAARRLLALPALTNAHDHARVTSTTAYGGAGKPLETWIAYLALLPSVDPYLAARGVAVAQRARRRRRRHGALHPRPGPDRSADRGGRGRARGARCRRAGGLCGRDAQPQSAGLRAVGADPRRAVAAGPRRRSRSAICARRCRSSSRSRWSMRWPRPRPIRCSTCSTARRRCNGARTSFSKRSRTRRSAPAAAFTCICSRPARSARGSTPTIRAAS